ncbi:outer membrane protein TolC [Balneicella halophila]|uniref:Outer membrane protein TolC n=1 Tax=Balneicella halophila TaxID=1537566 RepID=A0A7L4URK0_BALHA|nr:TolC family protein [Balneicella halophila]PVX52132.1 outer membrane protein TolC [Balneicella halophila]
MFSKRLFISLILLCGFLSLSQAQQTISLEELLSKALANNMGLQQQALQADIEQLDAEKSNAVFLPRVNASYSFGRTNDPLNVFGTKLKQKIIQQADFAPDLLNNPDGMNSYNALVKVEQPIFNLDGIYMRSAARAKALASKHQLAYGKEYLTFQVKQLFAQLQLLYAANDVLEKAKKTVEANVNLVENLSKQGYTKPSDELEVNVRLTDMENKILNNKINIQNLSDQLYYIMGQDAKETLKPTTEIKEIPSTVGLLPQSNLETERDDLLAYRAGIDAQKNMLKASRSKFSPRVNAFGQYEINNHKLFQGDADNYMVGMRLSWNLFNGTQNIKDIQKNKVALEKAEVAYEDYLTKSQAELNKAHRDVENALAKIALAEKALNQAKESYRIRKNRFEEGLEKTTDLLKDDSAVEEKHLNYLQELFQLKVAVYYIEFLTSTK